MASGYAWKKALKKPLSKIFLLISLSTFSLSIYSVLQHWEYKETLVNIPELLHSSVTAEQIGHEIEQSIAAAEFDDARIYLKIAQDNHYPIDVKKYQQEIERQDTSFRAITSNVSNFISGFAKGKSDNMAGLAGAVSADFTVIGDVRDLRKEYQHYSKDEDVNELVVLLSGAGVGLTALTVGSMGSAGPAKAGASTLKAAVKMGRITARFQKELLKLGRKVFDWALFTRLTKQDKSLSNISRAAKQAYKPTAVQPLKRIASQVNSIRKNTSTIDTVHLLKYVETSDDLTHLEKVSIKLGRETKATMKLLGKGALRTVRVLRKTTTLLLSLLGSLVSGLLSIMLLFRFVIR